MLANLLQAIGSVSWSFFLWRPSLRVSLYSGTPITSLISGNIWLWLALILHPVGWTLFPECDQPHPSHSGKTQCPHLASSPPFGALRAGYVHVPLQGLDQSCCLPKWPCCLRQFSSNMLPATSILSHPELSHEYLLPISCLGSLVLIRQKSWLG